MRISPVRLPLFIALIATALSCSGNGTINTSASGQNPLDAAARIELSDPQASLGTVDVNGVNVSAYNWKVKYRFTQGKPEPALWYMCRVDDGTGVSLLEVSGKDLKPEGAFEKSGNAILKSTPKTLTMSVLRGRGKGSYRDTISNEITCPVKE
jgi:hypothetical protein